MERREEERKKNRMGPLSDQKAKEIWPLREE